MQWTGYFENMDILNYCTIYGLMFVDNISIMFSVREWRGRRGGRLDRKKNDRERRKGQKYYYRACQCIIPNYVFEIKLIKMGQATGTC